MKGQELHGQELQGQGLSGQDLLRQELDQQDPRAFLDLEENNWLNQSDTTSTGEGGTFAVKVRAIRIPFEPLKINEFSLMF